MSSAVDQATATGNMYRKFCEIWSCCFWDICLHRDTSRQTYRDADHNKRKVCKTTSALQICATECMTCSTTTYPVISSWWANAEMSMSEICPRQVDGSIKGKLHSQPRQTVTKTNHTISTINKHTRRSKRHFPGW